MEKDYLEELIEEMEKIQGNWNGDKSGYQEDQANIAKEIQEKAREIQELIKALNGTN